MQELIKGLHHVTAMARDAQENNRFYTHTLGLRRVKKTVNFDAPDVYHLYYADGAGTPGSVMTYFPFPNAARGVRGTGEVSTTSFTVPEGSLGYWRDRLTAAGTGGLRDSTLFGAKHLFFEGPDGDGLALVEDAADDRTPWVETVPADYAVRGFKGVSMLLADTVRQAELLQAMGYEEAGSEGRIRRFRTTGGNAADTIDLEAAPERARARPGAGSVHHVAFAVDDRAAQLKVRQALLDLGEQVTPVIDRDYFWAIYFRTPGGVLFEVATNEPGFARDEAPETLGRDLKLPAQHAHLRPQLERLLPPIGD